MSHVPRLGVKICKTYYYYAGASSSSSLVLSWSTLEGTEFETLLLNTRLMIHNYSHPTFIGPTQKDLLTMHTVYSFNEYT